MQLEIAEWIYFIILSYSKQLKVLPILCVLKIWINDLAYLELQVMIVDFCFFDSPSGVYFIHTMLILTD